MPEDYVREKECEARHEAQQLAIMRNREEAERAMERLTKAIEALGTTLQDTVDEVRKQALEGAKSAAWATVGKSGMVLLTAAGTLLGLAAIFK